MNGVYSYADEVIDKLRTGPKSFGQLFEGHSRCEETQYRKKIDMLMKEGYIKYNKGKYMLTQKGWDMVEESIKMWRDEDE